jgi:periplasmic divalent cation tolerance protein
MYVAIYTTFDSLKEAKEFSRLLLEKKLVSCVNLIKDVHSIYRWKGKIDETTEIILW